MKLIKQPLVHFFLLGGAIFILFYIIDSLKNDNTSSTDLSSKKIEEKIIINDQILSRLTSGWESRWRSKPENNELRLMLDKYLQQEVLYREAIELGLDKNDEIIRRRLSQKLQFLAKDMIDNNVDEKDLKDFYQKKISLYKTPSKYDFYQLYINPDKHDDPLSYANILHQELSNLLQENSKPLAEIFKEVSPNSDSSFLSFIYQDTSTLEINKYFGQSFVDQITKLNINELSPIISSGLGLHIVLVKQITKESTKPFQDVKEQVRNDYLYNIEKNADDKLYKGLLHKYQIVNQSSNTNIDKWLTSTINSTKDTNK